MDLLHLLLERQLLVHYAQAHAHTLAALPALVASTLLCTCWCDCSALPISAHNEVQIRLMCSLMRWLLKISSNWFSPSLTEPLTNNKIEYNKYMCPGIYKKKKKNHSPSPKAGCTIIVCVYFIKSRGKDILAPYHLGAFTQLFPVVLWVQMMFILYSLRNIICKLCLKNSVCFGFY